MKDIIRMANKRPRDIKDIYTNGMEKLQSNVTTADAYFLMRIILDPDIQPKIFKQMFRGVLTKNQSYPTAEETFESINEGEVFMFTSKQGPISLDWIDLMNGIHHFMSMHYGTNDGKVYKENKTVCLVIELMDEEDIVDILMFSLFGGDYKHQKQEVLEAIRNDQREDRVTSMT